MSFIIAFFLSTAQVFAAWNGTFFSPGETLNPTCLPTDPNCDVLLPTFITNSQASSSFPTFVYASSTFPTFSYASSTYYLSSNPAGFLSSFTESDPVWNLASTSLSIGNFLSPNISQWTNDSGYISSSSLAPYITAIDVGSNYVSTSTANSSYVSHSFASSTFPTFSYASSTYYLASNPSGFISSFSELDPVYLSSSWASTTNNSTNWNTAYSWGNHAGLYDPAGTATSTLNNWLSLNPTSGTNTGDITLSNNTNGLTLSNQVLTMGLAGASATGTLSSIDWNTFNNKASSQWTTGTGNISYSGGNVGIGTSTPVNGLDVGSNTTGLNEKVYATIGSELAPALTSGNFTLGTGWQYLTSPNRIDKNADGTGTVTPTAATNILAGKTYKVVIVVDSISGGSATYTVGSHLGTTLSAATTYTDYITAAATGKLIITPSVTGLRMTISSISIKALTDNTGDLTVEGNLKIGSPIQSLSGANAITVDPSGFVGILNTHPLYTLDVNGTLSVNGGGIRTTSLTNLTSYTNSYWQMLDTGTNMSRNKADANPALIIQQVNASSTGDILQLQNNAGTVAKITQAGNLGVGVTTPTSRIHASTTLSASSTGVTESAYELDYTVNKGAGNDTGLLISKTNTASPGTSYFIDAKLGGTTNFSVTAGGSVFAAGNSIYSGTIQTAGIDSRYDSSTLYLSPFNGGNSPANATSRIGVQVGGTGYHSQASDLSTGGTQTFFKVAPIYNQTSSTSTNTDLLINRTETSIGSGAQYLMNAQVGGVSKFSLSNTGNAYYAGSLGIGTTTPATALSVVGTVSATSFIGDGSALTGITSFSTSTTRSIFSTSATGLTYSTSTGDTSLTSGYNIPLTSSTTAWNNTVSSQWSTTGLNISYSGGNVGIGTSTPNAKLQISQTGAVGDVALSVFDQTTGTEDFQIKKVSSGSYRILGRGLGTVSAGDTSGFQLLTSGNAAQFMDAKGIFLGSAYGTPTIDAGEIETGSGINLTLSPAGTTAMTLLSTGNVGIGTTTPGTTLDVAGIISAGIGGDATSGTPLLLGRYTNGNLNVVGALRGSGETMFGYGVKPSSTVTEGFISSTGINIGRSSFEGGSGFMRFLVANTQTVAIGTAVTMNEAMRITSTGKVGIGTTAPNTQLDVVSADLNNTPITSTNYGNAGGVLARRANGTVASPTTLASGDLIGAILTRGHNGSAFTSASNGGVYIWAGETWTTGANGTYVTFDTSANGGTSRTEKMRILGNGNVGIGTTAPAAKLEVHSATFPVVQIQRDVTGGSGAMFGGANLELTNTTPATNNGIAFYFKAPNASGGSTYAGAFGGRLSNITAGSEVGDIAFQSSWHGQAPTTDDLVIRATGASTGDVLVPNGNLGVGTTTASAQLTVAGTIRFASLGSSGGNLTTDSLGNITVSSDEKMKDIQGNYERGLDDVMKITPIMFKWKKETGYDTTNVYSGFSAENMSLAIPEAVSTSNSGTLTLADRPVIAALVNSVKQIGSFIVKIEGGLAYLKNIVVETLVVGSASKPSGITMYDEDTGNVYCVKVRNGSLVNEPGACNSLVVLSSEVKNNKANTVNTGEIINQPAAEPIISTSTESGDSTPTVEKVSTTDSTSTTPEIIIDRSTTTEEQSTTTIEQNAPATEEQSTTTIEQNAPATEDQSNTTVEQSPTTPESQTTSSSNSNNDTNANMLLMSSIFGAKMPNELLLLTFIILIQIAMIIGFFAYVYRRK